MFDLCLLAVDQYPYMYYTHRYVTLVLKYGKVKLTIFQPVTVRVYVAVGTLVGKLHCFHRLRVWLSLYSLFTCISQVLIYAIKNSLPPVPRLHICCLDQKSLFGVLSEGHDCIKSTSPALILFHFSTQTILQSLRDLCNL